MVKYVGFYSGIKLKRGGQEKLDLFKFTFDIVTMITNFWIYVIGNLFFFINIYQTLPLLSGWLTDNAQSKQPKERSWNLARVFVDGYNSRISTGKGKTRVVRLRSRGQQLVYYISSINVVLSRTVIQRKRPKICIIQKHL